MQEEPDVSEITWQQVFAFMQQEVFDGEKKGYPKTLRNLIGLLLQGVEIILPMVEYIQDPENLVNKICPQCGKLFTHPSRWVKTCSQRCHDRWLKDPCGYLGDDSNIGSTLLIMQEMELEEKT